MKNIFKIIFLIFSLYCSSVFAAYYGYNSGAAGSALDTKYPWIDISSTSTSPGTSVTLADDATITGRPIGFTFKFSGVNYTTVRIGSNGIVAFARSVNNATNQNILTNTQNGAWRGVVPFWDDLDPSVGGEIRYKTTGLVGDRIFTVSYIDVRFFGSTSKITFQVQFYEGINSFIFKYGSGTGTGSDGNSASIGVVAKNTTTKDLMSYSFNTANAVSNGLTIEWYPLNLVDHYEFDFGTDNKGTVCIAKPISVRSCATSSSPCTSSSDLYPGAQTSTLTTTLGTFSTSPITYTGIGNVTLTAPASGTAAIGISGQTPVCFAGGASAACNIAVSGNGNISLTWPSETSLKEGIYDAGSTSGLVKISVLSGCSATPLIVSKNSILSLKITYLDPITGSKSATVTPYNSSGVATGSAQTISTSNQNITFAFDASGNSYMKIKYTDAGKIGLTLTSSPPAVSANGTKTIISKPYTMKLFNAITDVTCTDGTTTTTLPAITSNKFCHASDIFSAKVRAYGEDGAILPNFGKESASDNLKIYGSIKTPIGGDNGNLTNEDSSSTDTLTNGVVITKVDTIPVSTLAGAACTNSDCFFPVNLSWDNVGEINLTPIVNGDNYFGAGAMTLKTSQSFGRFYPFGFQTTTSSIVNRNLSSCAVASPFSYTGENFQILLDLKAVDKDGNVTTNYSTQFDPSLAASWNLVASNATTNYTSKINFVSETGSWSSGVLNAALNLKFTRSSMPDGPFNNVKIGISPLDSDGTKYSIYNLDSDLNGSADSNLLGTTNFYYGMMKISTVTGNDASTLAIPVEVQYYNGIGFTANGQDSCTSFSSARFSTNNFTNFLASNEIALTYPTSVVAGVASVAMAKPSGGDGKYVGSFDLNYDLLGDSKTYLFGKLSSSTYVDNPKATIVLQAKNQKSKILFVKPTF